MSEPVIPPDLKSQDQRSVIFSAAADLHTTVLTLDREITNFPYQLVRDGIIPQAQAEKEQMLLAVARRILDVRRQQAWMHWFWALTGKPPEQEFDLNAKTSPVGVQDPSGPDGRLREGEGVDQGGSPPLHNPSAQTSTQHGGVAVP